MVEAKEVAKYFISKDVNNKLFNNKLITLNGRNCYEGNVRINKYLYFSQTVYLAKYGKLLFKDNILAYDNGPIIKDIMEKYLVLQANKSEKITLDESIKKFLDKIYIALEKASCEELIEITHEDTAWKDLRNNTYNAPIIDVLKYQEKYKKQYAGIIKVMEI